jgi:hypothetical protein
MNKSVTTVALTTSDERVRDLTRQLYACAGKRVRVTFIKKNGDTRVMDCVPRVQYNATMGILSTPQGKSMVATKAHRDMITVAEIVGNTLQPRTINLRTVVGDIVVLGL